MITFNGIHSSDPSLDIISVMRASRPISPGHDARVLSITGMDGVIYQGKDRKPQFITFRFVFDSDSYADKRTAAREIAAWLDTEELSPLIFDDEPDKRYMAIVIDEIDVEEILLTGIFYVTLFVPSSYAESTTTKTASPNEGTAETPCIITVTMTSDDDSLKITLDETGEFVLLNHDLYVGDEVIIDTNARTVTVNDVDVRADLSYLSDYFKLPRGTFTLTPDPVSTVEVEFRERWK